MARGLSLTVPNICANGPAVEGVNVTRRSHPVTSPGTSAENCPGGEEGMAQFLPVPATDKIVSVAGFVQSRSHEFGR